MSTETPLETAETTALTNEATNLKEAEKPMYGIHYGEAYESDLDVVEIAKRVRIQLRKEAKSKHSALAGSKASVRIERYSMGRSINVRLNLPFSIEPEEDQIDEAGFPRYLSRKAAEAKHAAQALLDSFNYDGSDSMTDYYNVNFAGLVTVYEMKED